MIDGARVIPFGTGWRFGRASAECSQPGFDDSGFAAVMGQRRAEVQEHPAPDELGPRVEVLAVRVSSSARSARSAAVRGAEPSVCAAAWSSPASDAGSPRCAAWSR